nr:hypothetical protein CFP56_52514 [Quercus suber]
MHEFEIQYDSLSSYRAIRSQTAPLWIVYGRDSCPSYFLLVNSVSSWTVSVQSPPDSSKDCRLHLVGTFILRAYQDDEEAKPISTTRLPTQILEPLSQYCDDYFSANGRSSIWQSLLPEQTFFEDSRELTYEFLFCQVPSMLNALGSEVFDGVSFLAIGTHGMLRYCMMNLSQDPCKVVGTFHNADKSRQHARLCGASGARKGKMEAVVRDRGKAAEAIEMAYTSNQTSRTTKQREQMDLSPDLMAIITVLYARLSLRGEVEQRQEAIDQSCSRTVELGRCCIAAPSAPFTLAAAPAVCQLHSVITLTDLPEPDASLISAVLLAVAAEIITDTVTRYPYQFCLSYDSQYLSSHGRCCGPDDARSR